jgi:hypothetical protein
VCTAAWWASYNIMLLPVLRVCNRQAGSSAGATDRALARGTYSTFPSLAAAEHPRKQQRVRSSPGGRAVAEERGYRITQRSTPYVSNRPSQVPIDEDSFFRNTASYYGTKRRHHERSNQLVSLSNYDHGLLRVGGNRHSHGIRQAFTAKMAAFPRRTVRLPY